MSVYELSPHETGHYDDFSIVRVPGGWVYRFHFGQENEYGVFVPFSLEFESVPELLLIPKVKEKEKC